MTEPLQPIPYEMVDTAQIPWWAELGFILDDLPETSEANTAPWHPNSLGEWVWVDRKRADATAELATIRETVTTEIARIEAWAAKVSAPHERKVMWADHLLMDEALNRRESDPKAKSFVLPHVTVKTRESKGRTVIDDPASAVEWAKKECPGAVRTTSVVQVSLLPALTRGADGVAVTEDGTVVPGVTLTGPSITATITETGLPA